MRDTIHPVRVVPMLAPMMTPIAALSDRRPAFTKDTTITLVAEEDWMTAVTTKPVSTATKRFLVMKPSARCILSPAACWMPSLITFIP